jgi:hypothetical protein
LTGKVKVEEKRIQETEYRRQNERRIMDPGYWKNQKTNHENTK